MRRMKLRIATYNIHKGVTSFRSTPRIHALKHAMTSMEADILFLQEVQGRHDWHAARHAHAWPNEAQHEFLAGDSHHAAYGKNAVYDHGHHGNALLSSYPIGAVRNHDVSDHRFEQRGILHCMVQTPQCIVHCYVVHLGLFAGGRRRQALALIEAVLGSARSNDPIIIAGDFNDWGNQLSPILRNRLGVTEVFDNHADSDGQSFPRPARTFPAFFPCLPMDRIYVRGFAVHSAHVLHGLQWAKLSDHAPVLATVQLNLEKTNDRSPISRRD
jgi:endonuclease/exonuclease/phosphatase family metal-dependent hydrolase